MGTIRHFIDGRCTTALLLVVAALLMRMIVPAGYMAAVQDGRTTIIFCHGVAAPAMATMPGGAAMQHGAAMPHSAALDHGGPAKKDASGGERPCAFASLSAPVAGGADPVLLADAIRFVVAAARHAAPVASAWTSPAYLTPPPRGPPALA